MSPREADRLPGVPESLVRLAPWVVLVLVLLLSVRVLNGSDIGYHLAYGERLLDTGRPVDSGVGLFELDDAVGARESSIEPAPGVWRDGTGRARFPNANWGSQLVMALVWRVGGTSGLALLQSLLVVATFVLVLCALRQAGVSASWSALGLLAAALAGHERFPLRPELFGYVTLAAMIVLLGPALWRGAVPGWPRIAALIAVHVVAVNAHGYFLFGIGLCAATCFDLAARAASRDALLRWAIALAALCAGTFVNPWGWRLALFPLQTVSYLRRHGISGATGDHPWAVIAEFFGPFSGALIVDPLMLAGVVVVAVVTIAGLWCAIGERRPGTALILVVGVAAAMSMRRNIAVAALLIVPPALAVCAASRPRWFASAEVAPDAPARPRHASAGAVVLAVLMLSPLVVTHRVYTSSGSPDRFGVGLSRLWVPLGAAEWIDATVGSASSGVARVWTDFNSSSNLHFFTRPHVLVPLLTNTWAASPSTMRLVDRVNRGHEPYAPLFDALAIDLVVLEYQPGTAPLARALTVDPGWALVALEGRVTVFLRLRPETAAIVRRDGITPSNLDLAGYADRLRELDPHPWIGMLAGATTLAGLGATSPAIELLRDTLELRPGSARAWNELGLALGRSAGAAAAVGNPRASELRREAIAAFERSLELDPGNERARRMRDTLLAAP